MNITIEMKKALFLAINAAMNASVWDETPAEEREELFEGCDTTEHTRESFLQKCRNDDVSSFDECQADETIDWLLGYAFADSCCTFAEKLHTENNIDALYTACKGLAEACGIVTE